MAKNRKITVQNNKISVILGDNGNDYISLTDMVKSSDKDNRAADIIKNWIRNRTTIEFLGAWETVYNPDFKVVEFDHFRKNAGIWFAILASLVAVIEATIAIIKVAE